MVSGNRVFCKVQSGLFGLQLSELISTGTPSLTKTSQLLDNTYYFPCDLDGDAGDRLGVWSVDENGKFILDFVVDGADSYEGIFYGGGEWWFAHSGDGSVDADTGSPSGTVYSTYDTLILGDSYQMKKLVSAGVMFEPLVSGSSVILQYRVKTADSWTTIFDFNTLNELYHEAVNIESSGVNLPESREIQFRIKSLNGAVITGLKALLENINSNLS
jgi:hypothetical protein